VAFLVLSKFSDDFFDLVAIFFSQGHGLSFSLFAMSYATD